MAAKRIAIVHSGKPSKNVWCSCKECGRTRIEECGLTAGEGQRWYCSERCLDKAERLYKGNGRRK
jgi:hypothetical protein